MRGLWLSECADPRLSAHRSNEIGHDVVYTRFAVKGEHVERNRSGHVYFAK